MVSGEIFDAFCIAFSYHLQVLEMADNELGETEMDGFDHASQTIWCGNIKGDCTVQVIAHFCTLSRKSSFLNLD